MRSFEKVHGLGNDFVLFDLRRGGSPPDVAEAVRLCDRRRGVGADGVLTLLPPTSAEADLALVIHNADGSVPEMCGNGLRCVVSVVRDGAPGGPVRVETGAGLRQGWIEPDGAVRVTLGRGRVVDLGVVCRLDDETWVGASVDMGNPHLVLFFEAGRLASENLMALAERFGPQLERHPEFPERVNVGFARRGEERDIDLVVYERGAGRTEACGTGAAACALAARACFGSDGKTLVRLPGGELWLELPDSETEDIYLTGGVARVYRGVLESL